MPNVKEQGTKTIEFSPIGNVNEITINTPETIKDDGMKPREREEVISMTEKSKRYSFYDRRAQWVTKKVKQRNPKYH